MNDAACRIGQEGMRRRLHVHAVQPMRMRRDGRATRTFLRHTTAPSHLSTLLAFASQNRPRTRGLARPPSPVDLAIYISVGQSPHLVARVPHFSHLSALSSILSPKSTTSGSRTHHVVPEEQPVAVRRNLQPPSPRQASAHGLARRRRGSSTTRCYSVSLHFSSAASATCATSYPAEASPYRERLRGSGVARLRVRVRRRRRL